MADALVELVHVLVSKDGQEKITGQEADLLRHCKSQALRSVAVGGSIATSLVWIVTRKLNSFNRVSLAGGAGFVTGMWRFHKAIDSCVDHILGMDGSRMQRELRKIILQKYGSDPERMRAFSKHFYCEEVFNDSTPEHPKSVYRQRNVFTDDQRMANSNPYDESDAEKQDVYRQQRKDAPKNVKLKSPSVEVKQVRMNPGIDVFGYGDPFDVLFGNSLAHEELRKPGESDSSPKVQDGSQRRTHRRHRMRHRHRDSLSLREAQVRGG